MEVSKLFFTDVRVKFNNSAVPTRNLPSKEPVLMAKKRGCQVRECKTTKVDNPIKMPFKKKALLLKWCTALKVAPNSSEFSKMRICRMHFSENHYSLGKYE